MSSFLEFSCPLCGMAHRIDRARISGAGAWGRCSRCRERLFVGPEGATADPSSAPGDERASPNDIPLPAADADVSAPPLRGSVVPIAEAVETVEPGSYVLKSPNGSMARLSSEEIDRAIENKKILPWDLVSEDGREFLPLHEHFDFRDRFIELDFETRALHHCWNHPERLPEKTCSQCRRSYCPDCLSGRAECPACAGSFREADPRIRERPIWQRPEEIARFPIEGEGWKITAAVAAAFWLGRLSLATLPFLLAAMAILVYVLSRSAEGRKVLDVDPGAVASRSFWERALAAVAVTVVVAIPFFVLARWLGQIGFFLYLPLALAAFIYYPMALGLVFQAGDRKLAFRPDVVMRAIVAIKDEYLMLLVGIFAVAVAATAAQLVLSFLPFLGPALTHAVWAYAAVVLAHLLGWTLYLNQEDLGFTG